MCSDCSAGLLNWEGSDAWQHCHTPTGRNRWYFATAAWPMRELGYSLCRCSPSLARCSASGADGLALAAGGRCSQSESRQRVCHSPCSAISIGHSVGLSRCVKHPPSVEWRQEFLKCQKHEILSTFWTAIVFDSPTFVSSNCFDASARWALQPEKAEFFHWRRCKRGSDYSGLSTTASLCSLLQRSSFLLSSPSTSASASRSCCSDSISSAGMWWNHSIGAKKSSCCWSWPAGTVGYLVLVLWHRCSQSSTGCPLGVLLENCWKENADERWQALSVPLLQHCSVCSSWSCLCMTATPWRLRSQLSQLPAQSWASPETSTRSWHWLLALNPCHSASATPPD